MSLNTNFEVDWEHPQTNDCVNLLIELAKICPALRYNWTALMNFGYRRGLLNDSEYNLLLEFTKV